MWGKVWKYSQRKEVQMALVLGIEVAVLISHLASRMVDISSTDKTEFGKHDNSSFFGTLSFLYTFRDRPFL